MKFIQSLWDIGWWLQEKGLLLWKSKGNRRAGVLPTTRADFLRYATTLPLDPQHVQLQPRSDRRQFSPTLQEAPAHPDPQVLCKEVRKDGHYHWEVETLYVLAFIVVCCPSIIRKKTLSTIALNVTGMSGAYDRLWSTVRSTMAQQRIIRNVS